MSVLRRLTKIGPGAMVAAAFIGPGTVTTATLSGARLGYTLLWAVAFSVIATLVLQEMSSRLGVAGRSGVGEAIRFKFRNPIARTVTTILVIGAILLGNAAYEAGNLTGAILGFSAIYQSNSVINPALFVIAAIAILLLLTGKYKLIERSLIAMVSVMGVVFIVSAIAAQPDMSELVRGLFVPTIPSGGTTMVLGIIGTTVVPYNLFLHASAAKKRWQGPADLADAKWDTLISVLTGGVITMAILVSAAAAYGETTAEIETAADLGNQLKPLLGGWSEFFIAFGFLAAGLSSAITAPLAAAFATSEVFGWPDDMKDNRFRSIWFVIIATGIIFSSLGIRPTSLILFAQVANGILLPVIAGFLVWVMNDKPLMKDHSNSASQNAAGVLVILVCLVLGIRGVLLAFGLI